MKFRLVHQDLNYTLLPCSSRLKPGSVSQKNTSEEHLRVEQDTVGQRMAQTIAALQQSSTEMGVYFQENVEELKYMLTTTSPLN